jgi:hypothetical protein
MSDVGGPRIAFKSPIVCAANKGEGVVVAFILYHRKPDGQIHYEQAGELAPTKTTTQRLEIIGPDPIPDAPAHEPTVVEHNAWLQRCRDSGHTVKVTTVAVSLVSQTAKPSR